MNRSRVLVVDDEVYIAHILEFSLGMEGFEVATANTGEEALKALDSQCPDLLVLDSKMPGMDGYEVCQRLRADDRFSDLPVIMLTPRAATPDVERVRAAGGDAFLTKPFRPVELLGQIRDLLESVPRHDREPVGP